MADMKDAVMDDKMIGVDTTTTMDEHGPGALEPKVLRAPEHKR